MRHLVVLTGSGISADSGIDTFRGEGPNNLWNQYDPDVVCNFWTWRQNIKQVHEFYSRRRVQLGTVHPNAAHRLIVDWQRRYGARLMTQNVDDLFERAGATDVIHVHGSLTSLRCLSCDHHWEVGYAAFDPDTDCCPKCQSGAAVKPNVVFFSEEAPNYYQMWGELGCLGKGDVLAIMGTSGMVLPVGNIARLSNATTLLSNLESAPSLKDADFDHVLHGRAADIAPELDSLVTRLMEC